MGSVSSCVQYSYAFRKPYRGAIEALPFFCFQIRMAAFEINTFPALSFLNFSLFLFEILQKGNYLFFLPRRAWYLAYRFKMPPYNVGSKVVECFVSFHRKCIFFISSKWSLPAKLQSLEKQYTKMKSFITFMLNIIFRNGVIRSCHIV
jgi:hypothetical protein